MTIKRVLELLECLERVLDAPSKPIVETDASVIQGYKPDTRTAILSNLYQYFKNFPYLKDVRLIGSRLQFKMPANKADWLSIWERNSKALQNGKLKLFLYDDPSGFLVEIQ